MMQKVLRFWILIIMGVMPSMLTTSVHAQDGIPDNCEHTRGEFYRPNIFPRYEPHNSRLVLVDWATGNDVQVLAEGVADTRILGWSVNCRYLTTGIGSLDSVDTVVWDTINNTRVGDVPDAHGRAHHITWGPGDYLVVETRDGAILWHVPTNTRFVLTTSFDTSSARNFSRLRWNSEHHQLTANLAVGGRVVYDLITGQETTAIPTSNDIVQTLPENPIVLGGHPYECYTNHRTGLDGVYASARDTHAHILGDYDIDSRTAYLRLGTYTHNNEALFVLETFDDDLPWLRYEWGGFFSSSCRYVAGHIGHQDEDASDTIFWDVTTGERVLTVEDAQQILHPVHWGVNDSVIVETRDGAYLYHLPTGTETLLTDYVETALSGRSGITSFVDAHWDEDTNRLYAILLEMPEIVTVFDATTGTRLETFPVGERGLFTQQSSAHTSSSTPPVQGSVSVTPIAGTTGMSARWFSSSSCNDIAPHYNGVTRTLTIRSESGERLILDDDMNAMSRFWLSPDCRYLILEEGYVNYDLPYDGSPTDAPLFYRRGERIVFWDIQNRERILELDNFGRNYYSRMWWSPDGERLVIQTTTGSYLVHMDTREATLLTFRFDGGIISRLSGVYWDYERGQVLVSNSAFDMVTGVERLRFRTAYADLDRLHLYYNNRFTVSQDNRFLFGGRFIYDLDTLEYWEIDVDFPSDAFTNGRVALSPDRRYLVMARHMIRVWDLQNLPEALNDRDPVAYHHGPDARIDEAQFIDNVTLAVTTVNGITYWNVETGMLIDG